MFLPVFILFDHGTPKGLIRYLPEHAIQTAQSRGWDTLSNGTALVVLTGSTKWSHIRQHTDHIAATVAAATAGSYSEIEIPFGPKPGRDGGNKGGRP